MATPAGSKKKAGFMTGYKKESMFKVPEGQKAKVGVVGSGQGMTDYQKRKRHDFAGLDE
jgi:survival-of-motor-neuron-related-splicing factor 30